MSDAERLIAFARALTNNRTRRMRKELRESVGDAIGTAKRHRDKLYSTTSSSGDEVPRGLGFLFSRNRLNVAISRAQCFAVLVGSPRLLDVRARSVDQMRLVNALCRFVELADEQTG